MESARLLARHPTYPLACPLHALIIQSVLNFPLTPLFIALGPLMPQMVSDARYVTSSAMI